MAKQANKIRAHQRIIVKDLQNFITIMGREAVKHYKKSFRDQGFTDKSLRRWQRRRNNFEPDRATLTKTGDLKRSVRIVKKNLKSVTVGSDKPYAKIHNDGGMGRAWGRHAFKMPKRQFIGSSYQLSKRLERILNRRIKKVFK